MKKIDPEKLMEIMGGKGTPKTLEEAIRNGFDNMPLRAELGAVGSIQAYVLDFLAQRFSAAMLGHPAADQLLEGLFKEIKKGTSQ